MLCGWRCGVRLPARRVRRHFANCSRPHGSRDARAFHHMICAKRPTAYKHGEPWGTRPPSVNAPPGGGECHAVGAAVRDLTVGDYGPAANSVWLPSSGVIRI